MGPVKEEEFYKEKWIIGEMGLLKKRLCGQDWLTSKRREKELKNLRVGGKYIDSEKHVKRSFNIATLLISN